MTFPQQHHVGIERRRERRSEHREHVVLGRHLAAIALHDAHESTRGDDPQIASQITAPGERPNGGGARRLVDEHDAAHLARELGQLRRARTEAAPGDATLERDDRVDERDRGGVSVGDAIASQIS